MTVSDTANPDPLRLYRYKDRYLDLESLQWLEMDGIPAEEFKSHSVYACRFLQPGFMNGWPKTQSAPNATISILGDGTLQVTSSDGKAKDLPPACASVRRETNQDHYLLRCRNGVAEVTRCGNEEISVRVFNETGDMQLDTHFGKNISDEKALPHSYRDLYFCDQSLQCLIYSSLYGESNSTMVMDLSSGDQKSFPWKVAGVVYDDNEQDVSGFLVQDEKRSTLLFRTTAGNDLSLLPDQYHNRFTCVRISNTLFVAGYHNIATGSSLCAYNLDSGTQIWKADVRQLLVEHSKYYNEVFLSRYKNRLILEGREAGGSYLQVFDAATGKRLVDG